MKTFKETYPIIIGENANPSFITITAFKMASDINGNPRYKIWVWSGSEVWCPIVKGYRRSKDYSYVLKCVYNLSEDIERFVKELEVSVNAEIFA